MYAIKQGVLIELNFLPKSTAGIISKDKIILAVSEISCTSLDDIVMTEL